MSGSIVTRLVMKDLYLQRYLIATAVVAGVFSIVLSSIGKVAFNVGSTFYLTTIIAYGVVLVMYSIATERRDKTLLFVLSLPLSGAQYLRAKMLAVLTAFCVPWVVLTLGGVTMILVSRVPDGMLPFYVLASTFLLMNFCVVLSAATLIVNEALITGVIILTNLSVTLFFILIGSIPAIQSHTDGPSAVWNAPAFIVLACEITVALLVLSLPFALGRSKRIAI